MAPGSFRYAYALFSMLVSLSQQELKVSRVHLYFPCYLVSNIHGKSFFLPHFSHIAKTFFGKEERNIIHDSLLFILAIEELQDGRNKS